MITKIKHICTTYGWLIWALTVALMTLLFWYAFQENIRGFLSSDALYLPSLYRDIFEDGYTLNGWTLNQATNFFPDMMLFSMLNAISGNFVIAIFCYSVIQCFAIIFIFYLIFKQFKPQLHLSTFAPAILIFASFPFSLFIDDIHFFSAHLYHNSYHNSAFIMALVCVYLFCKYLNTKSQKTLISILILSILSGACDKLFFVCFTIPVLLVVIVLFFLNKDRKTLIRFSVFAAIGTVGAILLWEFFINNPYFSLTRAYGEITTAYIKSSWFTFSEQFYGYLTSLSYVGALTYLSIVSYMAVVVYVFIKIKRFIQGKEILPPMFTFQLFVLFFVPIVLFTPVLAGSYDNCTSIRYNYFPYLLLPFNLIMLASNWLDKNKLVKILLNTALSLVIVGYLLLHFPVKELGNEMKRVFNFYPEKARIIDDYFSDETLKYGITDDYWTAKHVTMFSKKGVRLYYVWDTGGPWLHVSNKHWFTDNDKGKHAHCKFTFLIWSKEKEIPEFFRETNPDIQPIDLENWNLYHVEPYRYVIPGERYGIDPVLIDS